MSLLNKSIAGLVGSVSLTIVHQLFKKYLVGAPNLDQIGEEIVENSLKAVDAPKTDEESVFAAAMGGNILSNAVLFSTLATSVSTSQILTKTLGTGFLGAAGSMGIADKLLGSSNDATETNQQKWMTAGYYLFGAVVSIGVYNLLEKKK